MKKISEILRWIGALMGMLARWLSFNKSASKRNELHGNVSKSDDLQSDDAGKEDKTADGDSN